MKKLFINYFLLSIEFKFYKFEYHMHVISFCKKLNNESFAQDKTIF